MEDKEFEGTDSLFGAGRVLTVEGKNYTMRRLGIKDVYSSVNLIKKAIAMGWHDLRFFENLTNLLSTQNKENYLTIAALICGLTDIEENFLSWVASVIKDDGGKFLTLEDMYDYDRFPANSLLILVAAFLQHKDIESFFTSLTALSKSLVPQLKISTEN